MKLSKKLSKKTILIISGISVGVIILSIGLGVGLSLSSSSNSLEDTNPPSSKPIESKIAYRATSYAFSEQDIENNKSVTIDGKDYSVVEEEGKYYLNIPATNHLTLSSPSIVVPKMFDTSDQVVYNSLTSDEWGKGKDGFYQVDFMAIGPIKIIDTTIYGGFEEVKDNQDNITGYRVHNLLDSDIYPNGYQIGSFDADGGGINMLKLEKLKYLIDGDDSTTEENAPTTTEFGFVPYGIFGSTKIVIKLLTSSNPENNLPENIGISLEPKSNIPITTFPRDSWSDLDNEVEIIAIDDANGHIIGYQERSSDLDFKIGYFKKRDGSDYKITLNQGDEVYATKEVSLNELYMPLKFEGGSYNHNILGLIKQSRDGKIHLPNDFEVDLIENKIIDVANFQFNLPNIKLLLHKVVFNEENYATEATNRSPNELLISTGVNYVDYFRKIANLPQVKNLAKKYGVTIRFKKIVSEVESSAIKSKGPFDNSVSEVFFTSINNINTFNNKEMVVPLKFILKSNLENEDYFIDRWRKIGKIGVEGNKDQYGLYPISQSTQYIIYNKDYLPNGFDFTNKDISEYLYKKDLGNLETVSSIANEENMSDQQKTSLITHISLIKMYGVIWANNFYSSLKKDQNELDFDLGWKVKNSKNDFYSVLLDPNLKDDKRFQAWIDYYKNSNIDTWYNTNYYSLKALYNGHIGGVLVNKSLGWDYLEKGYFRSIGTEEEKKNFSLNKIGFQSIPGIGISDTNGDFGTSSKVSAMTSSLKNDPKKQEVAEMFIHMLTTNNNFEDLAESIDGFTPRKDVKVEETKNKLVGQLIKTMANTRISISSPLDFTSFFDQIMRTNKETLDYQNIIDNFKTYLTSLDYNVLPPENP